MPNDKQLGISASTSGSQGAGMRAMLRKIDNKSGVKGYKVGWPASAKYPGGTDVATVALAHEFGVPQNKLPERPFFRAANRNFARILGRLILKHARNGSIDREGTKRIAETHVRLVKKSILLLQNPPLKAATIARKKSSNPLIDKGLLRRSVSYGFIR
jgi:hypothetical protein